jgi:hypothetical protein
MQRLIRFGRQIWAGFVGILCGKVRIPFCSRQRIIAGVAILGLMFLSCVFGAALMYFDLKPAEFFRNAFVGAESWHNRGRPPKLMHHPHEGPVGVLVDKPEQTFDGYTLVTTAAVSEARLIDMRGNVVHRWNLPFGRAWPSPKHVRHPVADEQVHWFRCRMDANGDLLAIYQADTDTPHGYGLAKLDKDSKLIWAYSGNAHHDLDEDENGKIYTISHEIVAEKPKGLSNIPTPYLADYLVVISADGRELEKVPILEAFRDSPYALNLSVIEASETPGSVAAPPPGPGAGPPISAPMPSPRALMDSSTEAGDILHTNSVKVLSKAMAAKFPMFQPGQVLISVRRLDTIAVLDIRKRAIVWAAHGIWRQQHDAEFLGNGRLLIYDNSGWGHGARVLEYDPATQAVPWSYPDDDAVKLLASARGMKQRLPNGNTLIVDPDGGRLLEVSRAKEVVWEFGCPFEIQAQSGETTKRSTITGAQRYRSSYPKFLKGDARVRP